MATDNYVVVSCHLRAAKPKAILVQPVDEPAAVWVPRSLIHGADETMIDGTDMAEEIELRVFEWFAKREGLI